MIVQAPSSAQSCVDSSNTRSKFTKNAATSVAQRNPTYMAMPPSLGVGAKLLSILIMYIGRLGPLTVASLWYFSRGERISYPEGNLSIG